MDPPPHRPRKFVIGWNPVCLFREIHGRRMAANIRGTAFRIAFSDGIWPAYHAPRLSGQNHFKEGFAFRIAPSPRANLLAGVTLAPILRTTGFLAQPALLRQIMIPGFDGTSSAEPHPRRFRSTHSESPSISVK